MRSSAGSDGRAWRWALAVPVLLYAFQNWDLFAIAAMLAGLFAFERGRDRAAGAAFGLGAAVKLFPAIVVPPLIAVRLAAGDRRGALGWPGRARLSSSRSTFPFSWPTRRAGGGRSRSRARGTQRGGAPGSTSSASSGLPVHGSAGAQLANVVSMFALVAALGWLTFVTMRRRLGPFAAASAAVAIFVLCNKVYSPTYDVWLVVFFVLLPLSRRSWVTFCVVDVAVFVTVYGYFLGLDSEQFARTVLPILVAVRTVVLLCVVFESTRPPIRTSDSDHPLDQRVVSRQ